MCCVAPSHCQFPHQLWPLPRLAKPNYMHIITVFHLLRLVQLWWGTSSLSKSFLTEKNHQNLPVSSHTRTTKLWCQNKICLSHYSGRTVGLSAFHQINFVFSPTFKLALTEMSSNILKPINQLVPEHLLDHSGLFCYQSLKGLTGFHFKRGHPFFSGFKLPGLPRLILDLYTGSHLKTGTFYRNW